MPEPNVPAARGVPSPGGDARRRRGYLAVFALFCLGFLGVFAFLSTGNLLYLRPVGPGRSYRRSALGIDSLSSARRTARTGFRRRELLAHDLPGNRRDSGLDRRVIERRVPIDLEGCSRGLSRR